MLMRQTSVNEANKVDFVTGIRAILRQDPDIILVGEVRDEPTAAMAVRAAMTGHLVMTTLHTNNAIAAFARLEDLGVSRQMMAGRLVGVIAQCLLRRFPDIAGSSYLAFNAEDALQVDSIEIGRFNESNCLI